MRDHTKLRAFELADELALEIHRATKRFPKEEIFGLASQLRRASVSAVSNIVEGSARHGLADYLRFLDMAFGSAQEVQYQVSLAFRLGYLAEPDCKTLEDLCQETARVLGGLIQALRRKSQASASVGAGVR
jgi:four helix bundle protein